MSHDFRHCKPIVLSLLQERIISKKTYSKVENGTIACISMTVESLDTKTGSGIPKRYCLVTRTCTYIVGERLKGHMVNRIDVTSKCLTTSFTRCPKEEWSSLTCQRDVKENKKNEGKEKEREKK